MKITLLGFCVLFSNLAFANDPAMDCLHGIRNNATFSPLRNKVALITPKEQTPEMLSNSSKPNALEKKLIGLWVAELDKCLKPRESYRLATQSNSLLAMLEGTKTDFHAHTANLVASTLTYGDFAKQRMISVNAFEKRFAEYAQNNKKREQQINALLR